MAYVNGNGQVRVGVRGWVPVFGPEDPGTPNTIDQDSTNFILASGISDSVQTSAIETLVSDLKTYGLWTKMKAIYPFVGGSAASHKWNLKDPRDLDAAYRLVFNGGWVHSSNGAKPNGTTGYANPFYTNVTDNSSIWYYSRTNNIIAAAEMAVYNNPYSDTGIYCNYNGTSGGYIRALSNGYTGLSWPATTSQGFFGANRTSSTLANSWYNGVKKGTNTNASSQDAFTKSLFIAAYHSNAGAQQFSNRESAFVSIGDGLTDTEAANFNTAVQKFQTTLGRHVGTPYVSDPDAISFLIAAGITDGTQAAAINTLVIRMKADGVWTKMKAIYPFVGGTAASHKFNLKDPRDLDAAYRLVFNGGWTHTSTGALPNGTTGYADTNLIPNTDIQSINNMHYSVYFRNNFTNTNAAFGIYESGSAVTYALPKNASSNFISVLGIESVNNSFTNTSTAGNYIVSRISSTSLKSYKNGTLNNTNVNNNGTGRYPIYSFSLASLRNGTSSWGNYFDGEHSFASIGDGLTDTDATNLYSAVQAYQTTLGRQVNVPLVSDTDAQSFLNAANITSFQQASAVNKLVVDLKAAGVWSKMKAIYPFVGGSAASHKFNLKDPRDLDAAYRLVFNGGWTHTSTGAKPNGTTGYANTFFNPSSNFTPFLGYYSITNSNTGTDQIDMGSSDLDKWTWISAWYKAGIYNNILARNSNSLVLLNGGIQTDSRGWYWTNKVSTTAKLGKNENILTSATDSTNPASTNIAIGAMGSPGGANYYSNRETAFSIIAEGLSDTDTSNLYTLIQKFQTSLGRQVGTPIYNNDLVLSLDAANANSYPGTGTTWFDLATNTNGSLVNSPSFNSNQFTFNGTNQYVNFGNTNNIGTDSVTLVAWVKTIANQDYAGIVGKSFYGDKLGRFSLHTRSGGKLGIITQSLQNGALGNVEVTSTQNINTGNWVFVVGVIDRSYGNKLYINGVLDGVSTRNTTSDNWTTTDNFTIGYYNGNPGGYFNGSISNVLMYRKTLSDSEIMNLYNSTRGRFGL